MVCSPSKFVVAGFFDQPVFIVGINRVGKSTLHKALLQHPSVATLSGARESPFIEYLASCIYDLEFSERSRYLREKTNLAKGALHEMIRRCCFESSVGPHHGIGAVTKALLTRAEWPFGKTRWCVQTFPDEKTYRCLGRLYPRAQFVYATRNAIGAVQDQLEVRRDRPGAEPRFEEVCEKWARSVEKYRYLGGADNAIQIKFEDLFARPEETISSLLEFLDLRHHRGPGTFLKKRFGISSGSRGANGDDDTGDARRRYDALRESYAQIYAGWFSEEKALFREISEAGMVELGYPMPP